jgi:hypothetical protein
LSSGNVALDGAFLGIINLRGNRCGHDPRNPRLIPAKPIRKGKGGLPRILSLAAERAREWYAKPWKCPAFTSKTQNKKRQTRSERREACVVVVEALLSRLDLASLCLGTPTLDHGFIDVDMAAIVKIAGIGQRRTERAIRQLKDAGFVEVKQPRVQNIQGEYFGCRAIRVITTALFECLGLGPMLKRERKRASEALRKKAMRANRKLSDLMRRASQGVKGAFRRQGRTGRETSNDLARQQRVLEWNRTWRQYIQDGHSSREAQRRTNAALGYPEGFSPGLDI